MIEHLDEFIARVETLTKKAMLNQALSQIVDLVREISSLDGSIARVFSSPDLDRLCLKIGRSCRARTPERHDGEHTVFIATQLYSTGGHTRVLADIMQADMGAQHTLLITDILGADEGVKIEGERLAIERAPKGNFGQKLRWLQNRLLALSPGRIYMFHHPYDAVAVAAIQPGVAEDVIFYHHADHFLALGAHIPGAVHVDTNAKSFFNCRDREGIAGGAIWPLVANPPAQRNLRWLSSGKLITCCCGGPEKFGDAPLAEVIPYEFSYADMVARVLGATLGYHIHIGALSRSKLKEVDDRLSMMGVPVQNFVHVPFVPDLGAALVGAKVHLYLGSAPRGGGRATVEAMAAGVPVLIHANYRSELFSDAPEVYSKAPSWRTLDELTERLAFFTKERLQEHSRLACEFHETHHSPQVLAEAVRRTLAGERPSPPRPHYTTDSLRAFIDERRAYLTNTPSR